MILAFLLELNHWSLNHPLKGNGYQSWSGIISDIGEITLVISAIALIVGAYRHLECHQDRCHRLGRFTHGHLKLCARHHPLVPNDGQITSAHVDAITYSKETSS